MRQIPLTQGRVALVDDADFDWLNQWKWHALKCTLKSRSVFYAARKEGTDTVVLMHRQIASPERSLDVDHWDSDGLNNQRSNLRPATRAQNLQNGLKRNNCSSQFKGVARHREKWQAEIRVEGVKIYLGLFTSEVDAALAYNTAAMLHFGEFARLNPI